MRMTDCHGDSADLPARALAGARLCAVLPQPVAAQATAFFTDLYAWALARVAVPGEAEAVACGRGMLCRRRCCRDHLRVDKGAIQTLDLIFTSYFPAQILTGRIESSHAESIDVDATGGDADRSACIWPTTSEEGNFGIKYQSNLKILSTARNRQPHGLHSTKKNQQHDTTR